MNIFKYYVAVTLKTVNEIRSKFAIVILTAQFRVS